MPDEPSSHSLPRTRLRDERASRGLTKLQLGRLAGLSEAAISRYETGVRTPSKDTAQRIAGELHVPAQYLFPELYGLAEGAA